MIYDSNLGPLQEIKGKDVYLTSGDVVSYEWGWNNGGNKSGDAGGGEKKDAGEHYNLPVDVARSGNFFYVIDKDKHRLFKYDVGGESSTFSILKANLRNEARDAFNQNYTLNGQTVERALFYSNSLNDLIVFDPYSIGRYNMWEEAWRKHWIKVMFNHSNPSGSANGQLAFPQSVAVDSSGSIYVADTSNNRIQKFNSDGSFVSKFGEGELNSPKGLDVDAYGNIWVADTGNKRIVQFDPSGKFVKEYKSEEYEIDPQKITVKDGKIYIADANHDEPLVWNIAGEITNVRVSDTWFSPNSDGTKDDLNISYDLSQPAGVTIQPVPRAADGASAQVPEPQYALNNEDRSVGYNQETWNGVVVPETSGQGEADDQETIADGPYSLKLTASFGDYKKTRTADIIIEV